MGGAALAGARRHPTQLEGGRGQGGGGGGTNGHIKQPRLAEKRPACTPPRRTSLRLAGGGAYLPVEGAVYFSNVRKIGFTLLLIVVAWRITQSTQHARPPFPLCLASAAGPDFGHAHASASRRAGTNSCAQFADQRVYKQTEADGGTWSAPEAVTADGTQQRFTDYVHDAGRGRWGRATASPQLPATLSPQLPRLERSPRAVVHPAPCVRRLLAVCEDHSKGEEAIVNSLVAIGA